MVCFLCLVDQVHRIRITLSSLNVANLEKGERRPTTPPHPTLGTLLPSVCLSVCPVALLMLTADADWAVARACD